MYSRSSSGREEGYRIPEGYRGNAFSPIPPPPVQGEPPTVAPLPDEEIPTEEEQPKEEALPVSTVEGKPKALSPLATLLPPKPSGAKGIFSDIGLEELLILGVILLVSQSETDDDILLFLILLLFYK